MSFLLMGRKIDASHIPSCNCGKHQSMFSHYQLFQLLMSLEKSFEGEHQCVLCPDQPLAILICPILFFKMILIHLLICEDHDDLAAEGDPLDFRYIGSALESLYENLILKNTICNAK